METYSTYKLKCIVVDDEPHAISELEDLIKCCPQLANAASFRDTGDALSFLQDQGGVDIIFSDIHMPAMNGIDSARLFKKYCRFLIFVTAHREHAFEAFNVNASSYLVKPVSKTAFLEKVYELFGHNSLFVTNSERKEDFLFVKGSMKNHFTRINFNDIIFIEGLLNYVIIHTTTTKHITYIGLKEITKKLENKGAFIRINKSIIISANHISHIDGNIVYLSNKNFYTVGNIYKGAFHDYITKHTLNNG
ncbi:MAG: LytR/AlgR family response regulator transcription factor [Mucilaginibacter sp.]